jgi:hypothetical protein
VRANRKFGIAFAVFGVLAMLSWVTLSNDPVVMHDRATGADVVIRFRTAVFAVLGLFGALTGIAFWRARIEEEHDPTSDKQ